MPCKPLYCLCGTYYGKQRYVMATICIFYIIIMYCHRLSFSLAIVEMVVPVEKKNNTIVCALLNNETSVLKNIQGGTRKWSESDQAILLQIFYVGYLLMHVPFGYLCDRFGAKLWMLIGLGLSSISTALIPPAVIYFDNWAPVAVLRLLTGLGQAVLFPGLSTLMGRWIPLDERGTVGGLTLSANSLGVIVSNIGTGYMIKLTNSWVICFLTWAICGLILSIFFGFYVYSYPETHKHIGDQERDYLEEAIGKKDRIKTPFKAIFSDIRVWGLIITQIGYDYFHYTILSNLPKYMNNVLNYKITENAIANSLPQLFMFISAVIMGRMGDYLISKKGFKIVKVRIVCTVIALVWPSVFMLLGGYMNCNRTVAVVFFCLALVGKGSFYGGLKVNIIDTTINHSGFLMAVVNGAGSIGGIINPYIIAVIAKDNTLPQWHLVFWIMVVVGVVSCSIYVMFAKGNRAEWDYTPEELEIQVTGEKKCSRVFSCYQPY